MHFMNSLIFLRIKNVIPKMQCCHRYWKTTYFTLLIMFLFYLQSIFIINRSILWYSYLFVFFTGKYNQCSCLLFCKKCLFIFISDRCLQENEVTCASESYEEWKLPFKKKLVFLNDTK